MHAAGASGTHAETIAFLEALAAAPDAKAARSRALTKELAVRRGDIQRALSQLRELEETGHVAALTRADNILGSWAAIRHIAVQKASRGK